ncbi:hypothetical protein NBRC111893_682 [Lentilactobacillus kosonis]|uniref:Uncharacterized protein n=2 Tax=Lentilactobacillus kosonis TaxID=2810561 RepID=A0A401FJR6_9LACO|nr:hypothetical protein NBRC111893_682 [Lentilactobacillus kosonis]
MDLLKKLQFVGRASKHFAGKGPVKYSGRQRIINILAKENGMIQSQLAEILDVRPSSLAEILKRWKLMVMFVGNPMRTMVVSS